MFSRGQRLDWFDSGEIVVATLVAGLALYIFCVHSLTSDRPFVRLKLLADRNYGLGLILVTLFGMLNFATVVLLPPLLQQHAGYPDSAIGEIVGYRGMGSGIGFLLAMPMARLDPRISLAFGARSLPALIGGLIAGAGATYLMQRYEGRNARTGYLIIGAVAVGFVLFAIIRSLAF